MNKLKQQVIDYGLTTKKSLGQNFIFDENILRKIAGDSHGICLEIGSGPGGLTRELCRICDRVISIEIDTRMCKFLEQTMSEYDNLEILNVDFMKCDLDALYREYINEPFVVVANLPYYITTPVMMKLLDSGLPITNMRLLMQKEVAKRITAKPGGKEYGVLTVMTQVRAIPSIDFDLPPHVFSPAPTVVSSLLDLQMHDGQIIKSDIDIYRGLIRSGFGNRRKQLAKNLSIDFGIPKPIIEDKLEEIGATRDVRAERLSVEQFDRLCQIMSQLKKERA